ncbi:MAG TPA: hypothetical protein VF733_03665 [Candidatus Saccharimonadales bacterium]
MRSPNNLYNYNFTEQQFNFRYPSPDMAMALLEHAFTIAPWQDDNDTDVLMFSGRTLEVRIDATPDEQHCFVQDGPFEVGATIIQQEDGTRAFQPRVDTMDREGFNRRHPDMFAGRLLTRSVTLLEQAFFGGQPLQRMLCAWATGQDKALPPSDNYIEYKKGQAAGLSEEEAVFGAWSGRWARAHGFDTISLNCDDGSHHAVTFERSN